MDLTSYLIGKNSGGAPSYTIKAGTSSMPGYNQIIEGIEELTIDDTSFAYLFYGYKGSTLPKLKTTKTITNLNNTFYNCNYVTKIDLSGITFGTVTNASALFGNCSKVAVIDISTLDLTGATNYAGIFSSCGNSCATKDGAYAAKIPYVYVKNTAMQTWVLENPTCPSTWTTSNVIVKE